MKIFLLSLLVLLALVKNTVAQTYSIPWAQQQPAWVFPLWFEDASGAKDTLYVCYDADAFGGGGGGVWPGDSILGVKKIKIDTSVFYVLIETPYNSIDSIFQCTLSNSNIMPSPTFYVYNCSLPLTIRWDVNLFRSSALPFPNLSPAPRAQGLLIFDTPLQTTGGCPYSVLISDSFLNTIPQDCFQVDSAAFVNVFGGTGLSYFGFSIQPWIGKLVSDQNLLNDSKISVFPNVFTDNIIIKNIRTQNTEYSVEIFDLLGNIQTRINSSSNTLWLDLNYLSNQPYIITIRDINNKFFYSSLLFKH